MLLQRQEQEAQFLNAVKSGDIAKLEEYVGKGYEVNARTPKGHTSLTVAIMLGRQDVALWLLEHGGDPDLPDGDGCTPYFFAIFKDSKAVAEKARAKSALGAEELDAVVAKAEEKRKQRG
uniref:Ankyrin repeat domain-containing protein n=1 Tax=Eutreptiella gymnastica TaxID=73025 RepID=A0A7S1NDZ0_9EUGL